MCTVSIVPRGDGFRLVSNRDERISRPPALQPKQVALGETTAVFPVDPQGGGTWVGANSAGLVIALLNRSGQERPPRAALVRSRGLVIPSLLACETLDEALSFAPQLELEAVSPFRLVAIQGRRLRVATWNGAALEVTGFTVRAPIVFASSSLGDELVERPRTKLFADLVLNARSWLDGQFMFHRHQWPDRPELSVRMERPGVRTVSISSVDVGPDSLLFTYESLPHTQVH